MIIYNEFRAMATQKRIDVPGRFGVRLFSSKTLDELLTYLDELLANIPMDHRRAVKEVYPHMSSIPWLKTE